MRLAALCFAFIVVSLPVLASPPPSAHSYLPLSLADDALNFSGTCGSARIEGEVTMPHRAHFVSTDLVASVNGQIVFDVQDFFNNDYAMLPTYMTLNCLNDKSGKPAIVIRMMCMGGDICSQAYYYIIDPESGKYLAPTDLKAESALCDVACADGILGDGLASQIERAIDGI